MIGCRDIEPVKDSDHEAQFLHADCCVDIPCRLET